MSTIKEEIYEFNHSDSIIRVTRKRFIPYTTITFSSITFNNTDTIENVSTFYVVSLVNASGKTIVSSSIGVEKDTGIFFSLIGKIISIDNTWYEPYLMRVIDNEFLE